MHCRAMILFLLLLQLQVSLRALSFRAVCRSSFVNSAVLGSSYRGSFGLFSSATTSSSSDDNNNEEEEEEEEDFNYDYFNLENQLTDKRKTKALYKDMSIFEKDGLTLTPFAAAVAEGDAPLTPRAVKYDPSPSARGDPMSYGAYRRSQIVDEDIKKKKAKKAKSGPLSGVRDAFNKNTPKDGKDNKGKGSNQSDTDSFYNTIKRLGSGPVPPGSGATTGTADAPMNKRPIQPKKGLNRRNKKKIITPEDINGLFDTASPRDSMNRQGDSFDDDYDDNEDDDDDENDGEISVKIDDTDDKNRVTVAGFQKSSYNPMISPNEEAPKWLADAEKEQKEEAKKKRQMAGRKNKKLTDDWRFWAAIIGAGGFLTAFYNVFQQTGGFGTADGPIDELII